MVEVAGQEVEHAMGHPPTRDPDGTYCSACSCGVEFRGTKDQCWQLLARHCVEAPGGIKEAILRQEMLHLREEMGKMRVVFWVCPVDGHSDSKTPIMTTVEWIDGIAHCMTPGCGRTSADNAV